MKEFFGNKRNEVLASAMALVIQCNAGSALAQQEPKKYHAVGEKQEQVIEKRGSMIEKHRDGFALLVQAVDETSDDDFAKFDMLGDPHKIREDIKSVLPVLWHEYDKEKLEYPIINVDLLKYGAALFFEKIDFKKISEYTQKDFEDNKRNIQEEIIGTVGSPAIIVDEVDRSNIDVRLIPESSDVSTGSADFPANSTSSQRASIFIPVASLLNGSDYTHDEKRFIRSSEIKEVADHEYLHALGFGHVEKKEDGEVNDVLSPEMSMRVDWLEPGESPPRYAQTYYNRESERTLMATFSLGDYRSSKSLLLARWLRMKVLNGQLESLLAKIQELALKK